MGGNFFKKIGRIFGPTEKQHRLDRLPNESGIKKFNLEKLDPPDSPETGVPIKHALERLPPKLPPSTVGEPRRHKLEIEETLRKAEFIAPPESWQCAERGRPKRGDYQVYINAVCCAELDRIANISGNSGRESGAFLYGKSVKNKQGEMIGIWIEDVVEGEQIGEAGEYEFSSQVINSITKEAASRPGLEKSNLVGWSHTHPHMNTFLSLPDLDFFKTFTGERKVALVIAPMSTNTGLEGKTVGQFFVLDDSHEKGYRALGGFFEVGSTENAMQTNNGQGWKDVAEYAK